MKATFFVAAAVLGLASAGELKIDVTRKVKCERKTKAGDSVAMHYRGTLQDTGKQFDASTSSILPCFLPAPNKRALYRPIARMRPVPMTRCEQEHKAVQLAWFAN